MPAPRPARILVVDDVEANVLVLSKMVKVLGYAPLAASDGARAIALAQAEKPDLVLMDAMMPELDGIEATRLLKSDPATRLIPVVMVTALSDARSRQRAVDAGADDFISKPVDSLELQIRVKALLSVKRTYDELEAARRKAAEDDEAKAGLLASLAREMRVPLAAIASAARTLQQGTASPEAARTLGSRLSEQCEALTRLLDGLPGETGPGGAAPARDSLFLAADVVTRVAEAARRRAEEEGLALSAHVRPCGPAEGWVRGDRERIAAVLAQLAERALSTTGRGGAVRLATARVGPDEAPRWGVTPAPGAGAVLLAVEDTGAPIPPEVQARLLEGRGPQEPAPGAGGVDLAAVREAIERHGGRIGLKSEPGKGNRFTIVLPETPP